MNREINYYMTDVLGDILNIKTFRNNLLLSTIMDCNSDCECVTGIELDKDNVVELIRVLQKFVEEVENER